MLKFELVCLHLREHGYEAEVAGRVYVYSDVRAYFYWTIGSALSATGGLSEPGL